jgi:uncharacterized RDD family membrane protein YckC
LSAPVGRTSGWTGRRETARHYAEVVAATDEQKYPGSRFGLPAAGLGSVAPMGVRVGAFALDLLASFLIALLFTRPELPKNWSLLVWVVMTVFSVGLFGSTPGQAACGLRVAPVGGRALVGLWSIPRTALTFLIVPVLLTDADGRGLHDRLCRTVVIRTRGGTDV